MFKTRREALLWLSGLMDGEGCLTKRTVQAKKWSTWSISFRMTDKDSLEMASKAIEMCVGKKRTVMGPYNNSHKLGRHNEKKIYALDLQGKESIYALAVMMFPFLNARRQSKVIEFVEWYKTK